MYIKYVIVITILNFFKRKQLKQAEEMVKIRSQAAEGRWCLDKFHKSSIGMLIWNYKLNMNLLFIIDKLLLLVIDLIG